MQNELMFPKGTYVDRRKERRNYLKSQMDLARRLDKVCMNPNCNKNACFSWTLDPHHTCGRGKDFLHVRFIIILCRVDHILVADDIDLMISILEHHKGKPYDRWEDARTELYKKRDHLIYKRENA